MKFILKSAMFSEERTHRLMLHRRWDDTLPYVAFIGLNPSTANESDDDPTIKKVCKIAAHNGYGGVYMLNLFTVVSADPSILSRNNHGFYGYVLDEYISYSKDVVFAWGNFKEALQHAPMVINKYTDALCIKQNKNGSPKHPLYCKDDSKLVPFLRHHPEAVDLDDEDTFTQCSSCDGHDACADFGCAIEAGLGHLVNPQT